MKNVKNRFSYLVGGGRIIYVKYFMFLSETKFLEILCDFTIKIHNLNKRINFRKTKIIKTAIKLLK